jgi:hypothetical protein
MGMTNVLLGVGDDVATLTAVIGRMRPEGLKNPRQNSAMNQP